MVYAYIRISTEKQTIENQEFEIKRFISDRHIKVDKWIKERISSTKRLEERLLNNLLKS